MSPITRRLADLLARLRGPRRQRAQARMAASARSALVCASRTPAGVARPTN